MKFILVILILIIVALLLVGNKSVSGGAEVESVDIHHNLAYLNDLNYNESIEKVLQEDQKVVQYTDELPSTSLKYKLTKDDFRHLIHIGQLKLFLSEVEFLTERLKSHKDKVVMVYAGSSPCHHASYLSKMFPNLKMVLIDPSEHLVYYPDEKSGYDKEYIEENLYFKCATGNRFGVSDRKVNMFNKGVVQRPSGGDEFDKLIAAKDYKPIINAILNTKHKYYIIEDYFTNNLAELFAEMGKSTDFVFVSDIRSALTEGRGDVKDIDILWNSAMQYNWTKIMQPSAAMFKFRCTYFDMRPHEIFDYANRQPYKSDFELARRNGIDFIGNFKRRIFEYFKPDNVYIQAFPGEDSTETRLVVSKDKSHGYKDIQKFNCDELERKFFQYNKIQRVYGYHTGYEKIIDPNLGLDACGDCALMVKIFSDYYKKFGKVDLSVIKKDIEDIMKVLRRNFREESTHGMFTKKYKNIGDVIEDQTNNLVYSLYLKHKTTLLNNFR